MGNESESEDEIATASQQQEILDEIAQKQKDLVDGNQNMVDDDDAIINDGQE